MPIPSYKKTIRKPDRSWVCRWAASSFVAVGLIPMLEFSSFRAGGAVEIAGDPEGGTVA